MFLKKKKSITHCFVLHKYLKQAKKTWLIFDFSSPLTFAWNQVTNFVALFMGFLLSLQHVGGLLQKLASRRNE